MYALSFVLNHTNELNLYMQVSTWAINAQTHVILAKNVGASIRRHTPLRYCTPQTKTR